MVVGGVVARGVESGVASGVARGVVRAEPPRGPPREGDGVLDSSFRFVDWLEFLGEDCTGEDVFF